MSRFSRRDEAGFSLLPWLVLIAVLAATPILVPAAQDIHDMWSGKWNAKQQTLRAPTADDIPFIGPGLPADKTKADCVEKAASQVGLTWTAKGWRTSDIDEPSLSGDPAKAWANIAFFQRRMEGYVGSRQKEWDSCLKDLPAPPVDVTPTTEPPPEIAGAYSLQFQGPASDAYCGSFTLPTTIRVAVTGGSDISITANSDVPDVLSGSVDRGYGFSANGFRAVGGGLSIRMLGRFERTGTVTLVQSGALTLVADQQCDFTFTGTRTGP